MQFNKLVRDKIPAICESNGDKANYRIIEDDEEYLRVLTDKLIEEVAEVQDAPSLEELADVLEVVRSIGRVLGYSVEQIETERSRKAETRGGFEDRVFLISTENKK